MTQDDQRANFLLALDRSDVVELHGFEADFVSSNLSTLNFSRKQRVIIDRLITKYEDKIKWNPKGSSLAQRAAEEQKRWDTHPARFMARAGHRPLSNIEHVKEPLRKIEGRFKLERAPVVRGSVRRFGTKLEDHWIEHGTGILKAPFLQEGEEIEYDTNTA